MNYGNETCNRGFFYAHQCRVLHAQTFLLRAQFCGIWIYGVKGIDL